MGNPVVKTPRLGREMAYIVRPIFVTHMSREEGTVRFVFEVMIPFFVELELCRPFGRPLEGLGEVHALTRSLN